MSTPKRSKPRAKTAAKPKTQRNNAPSEAALTVAAVCITFLLVVDTYYIWALVQARS